MEDAAHLPTGGVVMSRRLLRIRHPSVALMDIYEKCRAGVVNALAR
jgi:hypothetical protein